MSMAALVRICSKAELPASGELREVVAGGASGKVLCIANVAGEYAAIDNECPHRGGPLAEGTIEDGKVMCPWHAWAFDLKTGACDASPGEKVAVYELEVSGEDVLVRL
jgi:nitrite reductase (NADH) small subunit